MVALRNWNFFKESNRYYRIKGQWKEIKITRINLAYSYFHKKKIAKHVLARFPRNMKPWRQICDITKWLYFSKFWIKSLPFKTNLCRHKETTWSETWITKWSFWRHKFSYKTVSSRNNSLLSGSVSQRGTYAPPGDKLKFQATIPNLILILIHSLSEFFGKVML